MVDISMCKHCDLGVIRVNNGKWWHGSLNEVLFNIFFEGDENKKSALYNALLIISFATIPLEVKVAVDKLSEFDLLSYDELDSLLLIDLPNGGRSCKSAHYGKVSDGQWFGWVGGHSVLATPTKNSITKY